MNDRTVSVGGSDRRKITWVVKLSKRCNLRCLYCYEYEELGLKEFMSIEKLRILFSKAQAISSYFDTENEFCWHGGEPLLNSVDYLHQVLDLQQEMFGSSTTSIIQTNLTILDAPRVELLKRFSHISISLDIQGNARVNKAGRDTQHVVLKNMATLVNAGLHFGSISVLSQANIQDVDTIFEFYNQVGLSFRTLPFYRAANEAQAERFELSVDEVSDAFRQFIDLWFSKGTGISIAPLDSFRKIAMQYVYGIQSGTRFDKRSYEPVFVIDTDGSIYDVAETYDIDHRYGNIFTDSIEHILDGSGRNLSIRESEARIEQYCTACKYRNYCSGWWASAATIFERPKEFDSCVVPKKSIDRCVEWIRAYKEGQDEAVHSG